MIKLDTVQGTLLMDVASEGKMIRKGTDVIISEVVDNFKNLSVEVVSMYNTVRLPFYGTNITKMVAA